MTSPEAFFMAQLGIIKNALSSNCYIMGYFNLNAKMDYRPDNHHHHHIPLFVLPRDAHAMHCLQPRKVNMKQMWGAYKTKHMMATMHITAVNQQKQ